MVIEAMMRDSQHDSRIRQFCSFIIIGDSGQEILEAAIVLPLLFLIMLGIFWFGRAFNIRSTLNRAARQALNAATQNTCATCGNIAQTNAKIVGALTTTLQADHLQTGDIVSYTPDFACTATPAPACTSTSNVQICTSVPITCGTVACQLPVVACGANAVYGTRVSFGYQYHWPLALASIPPITLHTNATSGSEN